MKDDDAKPTLTCRYCGQVHVAIELQPREHADCVRCGSTMARGRSGGAEGALAWAIAGLFLAVPAMMLPLATVDRLGQVHEGLWLSGIRTLWLGHLQELAAGALLLGLLAPAGFLALLLPILISAQRRGFVAESLRPWVRLARFLERWAMPEVYLLAVLVAFIKLGALVNVSVEPGLWCYGGMAFALLKAMRCFDFSEATRTFE